MHLSSAGGLVVISSPFVQPIALDMIDTQPQPFVTFRLLIDHYYPAV